MPDYELSFQLTFCEAKLVAGCEMLPGFWQKSIQNFLNVIEKAKMACENSGNAVADHFADVSKTIPMPKGASKEVDDFMLTRVMPVT